SRSRPLATPRLLTYSTHRLVMHISVPGRHPMLTVFFFQDPESPQPDTLSLHDALPILAVGLQAVLEEVAPLALGAHQQQLLILRSEEHTSELQSRFDLVCRLLLEKKKAGLKRRRSWS